MTHACTHRHRRSGCRCSISRWRPTMTELCPFSPGPLAINCRSLLHSNKLTRGRLGVRDSFGCFSHIKNVEAELRRELVTGLLSVDTNSLRHVPKRSSKNCDLRFANIDRFKKNNSIDGAIKVLRNAQISRKKALRRCKVQCY